MVLDKVLNKPKVLIKFSTSQRFRSHLLFLLNDEYI